MNIKDLIAYGFFIITIAIVIGLIINKPMTDSEILTQVGNTGNASACADIIDSDQKNECYLNVAVDTKNVSYCYKISDNDNSFATDICFYAIAEKTQDESHCNLIKEEERKYGCYMEVASDKQDISVCKMIPLELEKDIDVINISPHTRCVQEIALQKRQPEICLEIKNKVIQDSCRSLAR